MAITHVFWLSYFAYQRGESPGRVAEWLEYVSVLNGQAWHIQQDFSEVWAGIHERLLINLQSAISKVVEEWEESEAGVQFKAVVDRKRYLLMPRRMLTTIGTST